MLPSRCLREAHTYQSKDCDILTSWKSCGNIIYQSKRSLSCCLNQFLERSGRPHSSKTLMSPSRIAYSMNICLLPLWHADSSIPYKGRHRKSSVSSKSYPRRPRRQEFERRKVALHHTYRSSSHPSNIATA